MLIHNPALLNREKSWLERMLLCDFQEKDEIARQINSAQIDRDYARAYLCLKVQVNDLQKRADVKARVPV